MVIRVKSGGANAGTHAPNPKATAVDVFMYKKYRTTGMNLAMGSTRTIVIHCPDNTYKIKTEPRWSIVELRSMVHH